MSFNICLSFVGTNGWQRQPFKAVLCLSQAWWFKHDKNDVSITRVWCFKQLRHGIPNGWMYWRRISEEDDHVQGKTHLHALHTNKHFSPSSTSTWQPCIRMKTFATVIQFVFGFFLLHKKTLDQHAVGLKVIPQWEDGTSITRPTFLHLHN